ncbi:glycerol ether metabolic process [Coemansia sp. RSA 1813]|nr:glycerol ether metabolic process [Coemansia sp. RSA 1646]KAJ1772512.1 glycerol ether metabolic process [Coemansia sp. RSA 1843]KAJ2090915.1 glycerol ether metabolic process [Coemansia sp. RSA 986]KAJ2214017.1 glycerol ether metabolic process [Coemansia sp. RSA 487]KAJ2571257.1 glycerol ether metabolic process [Coemansia sp. RSA 1813]
MANIQDIVKISSKEQLDKILEKNSKAAVDFNASWCGSCKAMKPVFNNLAKEHGDVAFLSVDTDENSDIAKEYGITSMPTFKLVDHGKVVDEVIGANKGKLEKAMTSFTSYDQ